MNLTACIMAGGSGTRFWPTSRRNHPKQVLDIFTGTPLIQETAQRQIGVANNGTLLITCAEQANILTAISPTLGGENLIVEPCPRDTAAAVGLAAVAVVARNKDGLMAMLPADHIITPKEEYHNTIKIACEIASTKGGIVTIGIKPTSPLSTLGYMKLGEKVELGNSISSFVLESFVEKPTQEKAAKMLDEGGYVWNAGMFIASAQTILDEIEKHLPEHSKILKKIAAVWDTDEREEVLSHEFPRCPAISFDYGVMEKTLNVHVVEASFEWDDVGTWEALSRYRDSDAFDNVTIGTVKTSGATGNIVMTPTEKTTILIDVNDLLVVDAGDALLVCPKNTSSRLKDIVQELKEEGREDLL